jgi:hypothetical protein
MNNSVRILNTYFTVLKNLGYLNDVETLSIFVYIAVKELQEALNNSTDLELKSFTNQYLNGIKDNSCVISNSIKNNERVQISSDPVFGIVDTPQNSYSHALIEDLIQAMEDANVFMVL